MKIALYYAPTTCALVPWVNLTEAGATFETRKINMRKAQNMSPEFMALNPKHKVPLLVVDDVLLTENVAIQQWIARAFPAAKLLPADPMEELKAISLMAWCASGIHPHLARINSPTKFAQEGAEASVKKLANDQLQEAFAHAENLLKGRDYFFDRFTAVDPYFFWCFRRATQFELPLAHFKNCQAHFARLAERPSVKAVLSFEKATLEEFARG
jgi:glutathione S-transferase